MVEQLIADVVDIEGEEEALIPIEMDPVLLMTDAQIKIEVKQLPPAQRALFDDLKKFAEDQEKESGECMLLDTVVSTLVKMRYPGIPSAMAATTIKPEEESEKAGESMSTFQAEEGTSDKALIMAIFPSTDPAVINYNLKKLSAEHTDDDYESIGEGSDTEELDSIDTAQIWRDMAKLKRDKAALADKLAAAAPNMTQSDLLYSVEKMPKPSSHLPDCVEDMYAWIADPQKFRVALAVGE